MPRASIPKVARRSIPRHLPVYWAMHCNHRRLLQNRVTVGKLLPLARGMTALLCFGCSAPSAATHHEAPPFQIAIASLSQVVVNGRVVMNDRPVASYGAVLTP